MQKNSNPTVKNKIVVYATASITASRIPDLILTIHATDSCNLTVGRRNSRSPLPKLALGFRFASGGVAQFLEHPELDHFFRNIGIDTSKNISEERTGTVPNMTKEEE